MLKATVLCRCLSHFSLLNNYYVTAFAVVFLHPKLDTHVFSRWSKALVSLGLLNT